MNFIKNRLIQKQVIFDSEIGFIRYLIVLKAIVGHVLCGGLIFSLFYLVI